MASDPKQPPKPAPKGDPQRAGGAKEEQRPKDPKQTAEPAVRRYAEDGTPITYDR